MNTRKIFLVAISTTALLFGVYLVSLVVRAKGYGISYEYNFALLCFITGTTATYARNRTGRAVSLLSVASLASTLAWVWAHMIIHHTWGLDFVFLIMPGGAAIWLTPFTIMNYSGRKVLIHLLLLTAGMLVHVVYRYWGPVFLRDDLFSAALVWTIFGLVVLTREAYASYFKTPNQLRTGN